MDTATLADRENLGVGRLVQLLLVDSVSVGWLVYLTSRSEQASGTYLDR
jgi:hypothetical protein